MGASSRSLSSDRKSSDKAEGYGQLAEGTRVAKFILKWNDGEKKEANFEFRRVRVLV